MARGFRIQLLDAAGRSTAEFAFSQEYVRIGADTGCELCFPDADMAPVQALIRNVGDRFLIAAGDTLRPALVNGALVEGTVELRPADVVQTAQRRMRFVPDPLPAHAAGLPNIGTAPVAPAAAPTPPPRTAPAFPAHAPPPGAGGRGDGDGTMVYTPPRAEAARPPPPPPPRGEGDGTMVYTPPTAGGGARSGAPGHRADVDGTAVYAPPPHPAVPSSPLPPVGVAEPYPSRGGRRPASKSALSSPGVRVAMLLLLVAVALAFGKDAFFKPAVEGGQGVRRVARAGLPEIVGSKGGRTDAEIQANAEKEYQIADKRLEEHRLKEDNLTIALLHLAEAERLLKLLPRDLPLKGQVEAKRAEALALRDEKYRNATFSYYKMMRLRQYREARKELEFMLALIADPDDERYRAVESKLNALDETMRGGR